jgi:Protein of unknown function (DUF1553)/Protein of unknown function (DUF1549)/Planctomycete cytochrome C
VSRVLCCALAVLLIPVGPLAATERPVDEIRFFESKIRPVLVEQCYSCHAADAKKVCGELLLDTRAGIRRGGESGPSVVPNHADESLLLDALRHESFEMPPDRKLPESIIADFETWIEMGAPDPREGAPRLLPTEVDIEAGRKFWSFQPLASPDIPAVKNTNWSNTDIDRFILNRLEANGLEPVADADRRTLLRRAYFDLIGLPPTPEQIHTFLQDDARDAFEKVIDELLRSPHFGERWGRHWLDVVRFAESSGGGRTALFPEAWRYRDYVITAFNTDFPYDQFVKEQLAGDLLDATDWKQKRKHVVATAFLLLGPTNYELQDKVALEMDIVDEQLDTIGKALLGMTLGCARCHSHKFDPIPIRDYYALAGVFRSTRSVVHSNVSRWNEVQLPMSPSDEAKLKQVAAQVASIQVTLKSLRAQLQRMEDVAGVKLEIKSLEKKVKSIQGAGPLRDMAMAVSDGEEIGNIPVSIRGIVHNPGPIVPRGVLQVASHGEMPQFGDDASGRLQLAEWIVDARNPLTARVMVNRVWYWLYGKGLVQTVDNFGMTGDRPSHPELLDYLATEFAKDGWSIKMLIRRLMLSRTYQLSSLPDADNSATELADSGNRLLHRMNRRRLDAESIRDTLLLVSGDMNLKVGGPNITAGTKSEYGYQFTSRRRSVYVPVFRNQLPQIFNTFDFADPNAQSGSRTNSTTAPQALLLMNHPFVIGQSEKMADRLLKRNDLTSSQRIRHVYEQLLSRPPSEREFEIAAQFIGDRTDATRWSILYQTLIQSLDFRYLQ